MKVKCKLTLLELGTKGDGTIVYNELENFYTSIATHARLDLVSLKNDELIKSSDIFAWNDDNKKNRLCINLHFGGYTWRYDCKNDEIMLYNKEINI